MTATQVQAARILLDKSVPNLASITHEGNSDKPLVHRVEVAIIDPAG